MTENGKPVSTAYSDSDDDSSSIYEEPFIDYISTSNNYSWIQIRMSIESFADIAMRLLFAATSEANCERAISRQRLIHSNRRLRSSEQLLDARMILCYA
ncbi:hypothetical protein M9Y10_010303 [Tritrichomonas musculus]|uniref:HAT C-terminal dimerisation domain-containing protein n=1 Tax=Tritrichomonas musculus TaxID=1915356 RepID=A0ABR2IKA8_9EUKA